MLDDIEDIRRFIARSLNNILQKSMYSEDVFVSVYTDTESADKPSNIRVTVDSIDFQPFGFDDYAGKLYSYYGWLYQNNYQQRSIAEFMVSPKLEQDRKNNLIPAGTFFDGLYVIDWLDKTYPNGDIKPGVSNIRIQKLKFNLMVITDNSSGTINYVDSGVVQNTVRVYQGSSYFVSGVDPLTIEVDRVDFDLFDSESIVASNGTPIYIHYFYLDGYDDYEVEDYEVYDFTTIPYMRFRMGDMVAGDRYIFRVADTPSISYLIYSGNRVITAQINCTFENEIIRDRVSSFLQSAVLQLRQKFMDYNIVLDNYNSSLSDGDQWDAGGDLAADTVHSFNLTYQWVRFVPVSVTFFHFNSVEVNAVDYSPVEINRVTNLEYELFKD